MFPPAANGKTSPTYLGLTVLNGLASHGNAMESGCRTPLQDHTCLILFVRSSFLMLSSGLQGATLEQQVEPYSGKRLALHRQYLLPSSPAHSVWGICRSEANDKKCNNHMQEKKGARMGQTHHGQTVKHEPWLLRTMRNHCSKFERRSLHSLQCLTSHT